MRTPQLVAVTVLAFTLVFLNTASADEPVADKLEDRDLHSEVIAKLDVILKRLNAIERRLAVVEETQRKLSDWWVDDRGVMRSIDGRPIGYWGIDGPASVPRR